MSIKTFTPDFLKSLTSEAEKASRGRCHFNIHDSYSDPCQRLFNAIGPYSYIRPHRHSIDAKDECLMAVKGLFALILFEDDGEVKQIVRFGSERYAFEDSRVCAGAELSAGTWHTVIALVPDSVLLELKAGPFDPHMAKEFAEWAPEEETASAEEYLRRLRVLVERR